MLGRFHVVALVLPVLLVAARTDAGSGLVGQVVVYDPGVRGVKRDDD